MKTLVFKFTDKQFTALASTMHRLLLDIYIETSPLKSSVLENNLYGQRIIILILWELYLRISDRTRQGKSKYRLVLTEVQFMAFFGYFNPLMDKIPIDKESEKAIYHLLIIKDICDKIHQNLI